MTHRNDNKAFDQVLEVLIENGLDRMAVASIYSVLIAIFTLTQILLV